MIGANDAEGSPETKVPYFERLTGLDLDGAAGAQNDFLQNWRNALRLAKETRAPGIVCDLEFYNNYRAYDLSELARMTSTPREEVIDQLEKVGARMADIAATEYPGATLWFFFIGFTRPDYRLIQARPYNLAATYIVLRKTCWSKSSRSIFPCGFCPAAKWASATATFRSKISVRRSTREPRSSLPSCKSMAASWSLPAP
jgi:hypothetical protein